MSDRPWPNEPDWSLYPNFRREEFQCKCGCGLALMDKDFMARLQALRTALGFPLVINSGYRCMKHDQAIGGGGEHTTGRAADIRIYGERATELTDNITRYTFPRRGFKQHGPIGGRFIHLGTTTAEMEGGMFPSPWTWTYA